MRPLLVLVSSRSFQRAIVLVALAATAAFAACTLNPQPLPPESGFTEGASDSFDAGRSGDASGFGSTTPAPAGDAGKLDDGDGGNDGGDGGDDGGGDDAGDDAGDAGDRG
jgi:hypothetical protein